MVYLDNKSAILLEVIGKQSSIKQTKHIKMKYFFVKDKIMQGEIIVEHAPTQWMWVYILTKPKQGEPFHINRSKLMACPINVPDETLSPVHPATQQECVDQNVQQQKW